MSEQRFTGLRNHVDQFSNSTVIEPVHACLFGIEDAVAGDDGLTDYVKQFCGNFKI